MLSALKETALRATACLLLIGGGIVALGSFLSNEPWGLIMALALFLGAMFFGAWSRRV